jgi:CheY-like chemotaxis protein
MPGHRAALAPDVIFMDLGMPGIDGWETIRRLRQQGLGRPAWRSCPPTPSTRNLDNDVGIGPDDFIVKPFKLNELLDWLGAAGAGVGQQRQPPPPAAPAAPPLVPPGPAELAALAS